MDTDEVLAKELAKIGAISGAVGGGITGGITGGTTGGVSGGIAGGIIMAGACALSGAAGAYIASTFLPTETYSQELTISADAETTLVSTMKVLSDMGKIKPSEELHTKNPCLVATVGSGFLNMNPCLLVLEIVSSTNSQTILIVNGAAKEGLIKQNTAQKAVSRVVKALSSELSRVSLQGAEPEALTDAS